MTDAAKEARRAYKRKWAKEHPESVKESQRKYWERRAAAAAEPAQQQETAPAPEPAEA